MNYRLLLIVFSIVLLRFLFYNSPYGDGQKIRISGQVSKEVVTYDRNQQIHIAGLTGYIDRYPEVRYGDKITIVGVVDGNKLKDVSLEELEKSSNLLFDLRNRLISFYKSSIPEPHSSLFAGIALGSKSGMPESFWEKLKSSGTAHVVVASGMNVTLVGGFVLNSLVKLTSRKRAVVWVIISIWLYALMAGFDAPIVRAAIMGSIAFIAQALGRINQALNALLISVATMLIINPLWLGDVGFQLSSLATASLILFESKVERLIHFVPSVLRTDLATSLSAQIAVLPLLLHYFGYVNPLSPFVNALVLWTIPIITIGGMISGLIGIFIPLLGRLILMLIFPLSSWFVTIINYAS